MSKYLFTSERLGFREWDEADTIPFAQLNADPEVMKYFLSPLTFEQTLELIRRIRDHFETVGYCLYAVDRLDYSEFIGFIGLMPDTMGIDVSPCVEIGWRLMQSSWNNGFATEGAKRCIEYAFHDLNIDELYACTAITNLKSESVMKKIGMQLVKHFQHPRVPIEHQLNKHVLYHIGS